jgi:hypothetical protein
MTSHFRLVAGCMLAACGLVRAAEPLPFSPTPREIVERAIEGAGGRTLLESLPALHAMTTGSAATGEQLRQEAFHQLPDRLKQLQQIIRGEAVKETSIGLMGESGWIHANGRSAPLSPVLLAPLLEAANLVRALRLTPLLTDSYQLTALPAAEIDRRAVFGICATANQRRDLKLYFDRETGLLVKVERQVIDPLSRQESTEERYMRDYQKANGVLAARHIIVERDGKPYMEAKVEKIEYLPRLDDSVFRQP